MLIECKLKRPGGTKIDLYGEEYHFAPNEQGDHVCEITDERAIHRLVREIPEGYRVHGEDKSQPAAAPVKAKPENWTGFDPATVYHAVPPQIEPPPPPPPPAVPPPVEATPMTPTKPLVISDGEQQIDLNALELAELRALAPNFGITVHQKWNSNTIRFKIIEAMRKE